MKTFLVAGVLAVSTALLAGFSPNPQVGRGGPVSLKLNFKPGSKFSYTSQTVQNIAMQGNSMMQDVSMGTTFVVLSRQGNSQDLRMTYNRAAMKMDAGGQKMTYDSQDPATKSSPMAGMMGGMVGQSLVITVTSQGEVTAVKGVEEFKKSVLASNPNPALNQQLEQSLSESTLKSAMSQLFNIYPDHAVKPGESWVKNTSLNMGPAAMQLTSTYTLGSVQNGVAHVQVNGKLAVEGMATLTGTQSGTMDVDVATGLILGSNYHQTLTSPTDDSPMNISSDVTTTGQKL